jgi:hypothetical protein
VNQTKQQVKDQQKQKHDAQIKQRQQRHLDKCNETYIKQNQQRTNISESIQRHNGALRVDS